jgi:hypothetical protein
LTKENGQEMYYKLRVFTAQMDMEHPDFKNGNAFSKMKELRAAIKVYTV